MQDLLRKVLAQRLAKVRSNPTFPTPHCSFVSRKSAPFSAHKLEIGCAKCGIGQRSKRLQVFDHLPLFFLTQLEAERMALIAQARNRCVHHTAARFAGGVF